MQGLNGHDWLSTKEVARRTGYAPETMRNQRADGRSPVPWVKIGRTVLYRESDVDAYLQRRRVVPA